MRSEQPESLQDNEPLKRRKTTRVYFVLQEQVPIPSQGCGRDVDRLLRGPDANFRYAKTGAISEWRVSQGLSTAKTSKGCRPYAWPGREEAGALEFSQLNGVTHRTLSLNAGFTDISNFCIHLRL